MATQVTLNSGSVDSAGSLALKTNGTTTAVTINASQGVEFNAGAVGTPSITTTGDTNTGIFFPAADTIAFTEGGVESARIDASGNLGIGTTSPVAKFQVAGTQTVTGGSAASSANGLHLWFNTGTNTAYIQGYQTGVDWRNIVYNGSSHIWQITDVEKARITSGGEFLVGATSAASSQGVIQAKSSITGGNGQYSASNTGYNSGNNGWSFGMNSSGDFVVYINPAVGGNNGVYLAAGATSWTANSDERLKDITCEIENALVSVNAIRAIKYTLKADNQETKTQRVGLIAQDVQAVLPEIVDENAEGYLGIRYAEITPLLVKAIQEQQALITQLQADVAALKGTA